jgi:hypothetical protein
MRTVTQNGGTGKQLFTPSEITVEEAGPDDPFMWDLKHSLSYDPPNEPNVLVTLPFRTDFASVPWFFTWIFPRYGLYTKAAIVHDWLCRTTKDKFASDRTFRLAMKNLGVPWLTRTLIWGAVSLATVALICFLRRLWLTLSLLGVTAVAVAVLFIMANGLIGGIALGVLLVVSLSVVCFVGQHHKPLWPILLGTYGTVLLGLPIVVVSVPLLVILLLVHPFNRPSRPQGARNQVGRITAFTNAFKARKDPLTAASLDANRLDVSPREQRLEMIARSRA